jgi:hypothetical protein
MKKKIMLVSIFAVAILIFLSFTNVVGFQNMKTNSDTVVTPLFSFRNKRAINKEQDIETYDYLGKGKEFPISIPKRDNKKALFQDFIIRIKQMDDKAFNKFVTNIIAHLNQDDNFQDYTVRKIILTLSFLRNNPKMLLEDINIEKNEHFNAQFTSFCTLDGMWLPGCYIMEFLSFIFVLILGILFWIVILVSVFTPGDCWEPLTYYYTNCMEC